MLAIFHDLNLASGYCDRLHVLSSGQVVASGIPRAVLTRRLMREVFEVDAEIAAVGEGRLAVLPPLPDGWGRPPPS